MSIGLNLRILFILEKFNTMPPSGHVQAPTMLVPAPLDITGILFLFAYLIISWTWDIVSTNTTASGDTAIVSEFVESSA